MTSRIETLLKSVATLLVCGGLVVLFVNYAQSIAREAPVPPTKVNYSPTKICDDALDQDLDYSRKNVRHFEVKMHEGCFGAFVRIPTAWRDWHAEPTGDTTGYWTAWWLANEYKPRGPFSANETNVLPTAAARLQGHGTIRFFTNTAVPVAQPATEAPAKSNKNVVYKVGGAVSAPVILFRVEPDYTPAAHAAHFNGPVSVTVLVNSDGTVSDIRIQNSPGYGLEEKIIEALHRWKFKPAELNGEPVTVEGKIEINFREL